MTDLQLSLILAGGVIIVGVVFYNKWQEHRTRRSVVSAFSALHDDVLMHPPTTGNVDTSRSEPSFSEEASGGDSTGAAQASHGAAQEGFDLPPVNDLPVDALIDCMIPLVLENSIEGARALAVLGGLTQVGGKPVILIGRRADGEWELLRSGMMYSGLQVCVQMATKKSALNELEYSELITNLHGLADQLEAEVNAPEMTEVILSARELHRFVTTHDVLLGVNVQSSGDAWDWSTLNAVLTEQGFVQGADGVFRMPDGDGGNLFSLMMNGALSMQPVARLTLLLAVPCVASLRDGFGAMISCANLLAEQLGGILVDDASTALLPEAIDQVATQVYTFYDEMDALQISAGSSRALRLFA